MPLPAASTDDDVYDPDDVGPRSPSLMPMKVDLKPSPSPSLGRSRREATPESSTDTDSEERKQSETPQPTQGDAVLVSMMAGQIKDSESIARRAGHQPLPSPNEEDRKHAKDGKSCPVGNREDKKNQVVLGSNGLDLQAAAVGALNTLLEQNTNPIPREVEAPTGAVEIQKEVAVPNAPVVKENDVGEPMEGVKNSPPAMATIPASNNPASPPVSVKLEMKIPVIGELPPIRQRSPQSSLSNGSSVGPINLPSITDQLGDINHLADTALPADSPFPQSPPGRPVPRFSAVPGQGSPPKSPNDTFRRELPSPGRPYYFGTNAPRRASQTDGHQYTSPDYSSSSTVTPGTDQSGASPATAGIDRMSIDGITNPQIGGYQCNYPGCTAQPFQTQYLLNSHANVHSSNRPHYCNVKGCPRGEGGKGFKRKNEMIRHGLVHDSPGYVCPFCPDREHRYPRPDNLQRHVRVHHVDKDKDDPQLRDVLAQRPEGPSRGRRRRGGTNS